MSRNTTKLGLEVTYIKIAEYRTLILLTTCFVPVTKVFERPTTMAKMCTEIGPENLLLITKILRAAVVIANLKDDIDLILKS